MTALMLVKQNEMTYDASDPRCQLFVGSTGAAGGQAGELKIAFITVIDDSTQELKRYFGVFNWESREESIRRIMDVGGKWPDVFRSSAVPKGFELYDE